MSHQPSRKKSAPIAIILPIIIVLIILFQNSQDQKPNDADNARPVEEVSSVEQIDNELPTADESFLKPIGNEKFESPAGLIYGSGSADGHRLDHVMRHTQDNPGKPVHGVFNGEKQDVLLLLDEVWKLSQERGPPKVEIKQQGNRTVITADVGREIGYTGGESGKRKGYPKCSSVRLVVEGREVITAYPVL